MPTQRELELEQRVKELEAAYEDLQKTKKLLAARTAVAWIGMVSAAWGHSIKGDISTIRARLYLLRRDIASGAPIDKINQSMDQLDNIAQTIQDTPLVAPLSQEEKTHSVLINELLRNFITRLSQRQRDVQVVWQLEADDRTAVRISREWARTVIEILVDNALKAMAGTANKVLTVSTRETGEKVEIGLSDTGPGIPEDVRPKLFLEPILESGADRGAGLGLLLASTIVQTYGGDIRVGATGSQGTTMIITLPQGA